MSEKKKKRKQKKQLTFFAAQGKHHLTFNTYSKGISRNNIPRAFRMSL
jgi:hypothetical protein